MKLSGIGGKRSRLIFVAFGLGLLPFNLPEGSEVYADKAFNDYDAEDDLAAAEAIALNGDEEEKLSSPRCSLGSLHQAMHSSFH